MLPFVSVDQSKMEKLVTENHESRNYMFFKVILLTNFIPFFRGVTDAINQLLNQALTAAPGQKECDSAVRNVEGMAHVLDNPVEPVNEASFFECLDTATEKSQELARSMQDITTSLKKEDADTLAEAVGGASDAVCQLTESTAQVRISMITFFELAGST